MILNTPFGRGIVPPLKVAPPQQLGRAVPSTHNLSPRQKFLFLASALQADPPGGFAISGDVGQMDTTTLFVLVAIGLILLYNETSGGQAIDLPFTFSGTADDVQPPAPPPPPQVDPGPAAPPISNPAQEGNADMVAQAIGDLERAGRSTQGSCGAFAIANLVAWRLRPRYGLLRKVGGNRAIPQGDGGCLSGEEANGDGYATDYLIDSTNFFGYDILHDGGGENGPGWDGPETTEVQRNRDNFRPPMDPGL